MVEAVNLIERFDDTMAVDHMGATVRDGNVFGLIGTSGTGKSTFLRLISGVLRPDQGCITTDRHEVFENIPAEKRFLYISDERYFSGNTAPVGMIRYYSRVYRGFDEAHFHKLMGSFDLDEKRKMHTLSKGIKKQVSAIYGVCAGTDHLFCDETFDGLDPVMRQTVRSIFAADMEDENLTPIIASHNLRKLENICDHVGLLHKSGILLPKDLDGMKLNIHKTQYVLKPDMKPKDLTSLDRANVEQGGSPCTITMRGSRSEIETVMASYEPVFFECIPLSLEEILISGTEVTGYDIRKFIL